MEDLIEIDQGNSDLQADQLDADADQASQIAGEENAACCMLHAARAQWVKRVRKAQEAPGETDDAERCAAATRSPANAEADDKADLLDFITNQEDMHEAVNEWLFDLGQELEGLATCQPRDVCIAGVVYKAPLSSIFGTALEALSESNLDTI